MQHDGNSPQAALCAAIDAAIRLADELDELLVAAHLEQARELANCVSEPA